MPKAKTPAAPANVRVSLTLSEVLYDTYAERATKYGRTVEEELLQRLRDCAGHTSTSPIYIDDESRNALSQCAGRLLRSPGDVLAFARRVSAIKVGGISIELSEQLLTRLASRTFGCSLEELLRKTVTESLEQYVGMR